MRIMRSSKKIVCMLLVWCFLVSGCTRRENSNQSDAYSLKTDDQPYFSSLKEVVKTGDGYYYCFDDQLYFFDGESAIIVCNMPNCNHESENCNANIFHYHSTLMQYNGKLYLVEINEKNENYLVEFSKDGTQRKRIAKLFSSGEDGVSVEFMLHRGYLYFCVAPNEYYKETENTLYRMKIEQNAKLEKLITNKEMGLQYEQISGYGNYIYFVESYFDENREVTNVLKRYHVNTKQTEVVYDGEFRQYVVDDGDIYYLTEDSVYKMTEKEDDCIYHLPKGMYVVFMQDDSYFYLDTRPEVVMCNLNEKERKIYVITKDGKLVDTLQVKNTDECLFGDDKYLFFHEYGKGIKVYDKSEIGSQKLNIQSLQ